MNYEATAYIAAHQALVDLLDAEGAAAYIKIYDSGDVLLVTLPLDYPSGVVNGTTGEITFSFGSASENGVATGTASYAEIFDFADVKHVSAIACSSGTTPVSGECVMTNLSVVSGAPVAGVSFTIPGTA